MGATDIIGAGATIAGTLGGMGQSVDSIDTSGGIRTMQNAQKDALAYTQNYTNKAIDTQSQYFDKSISFLNDALDKALNVSNQQFNVSQALQAPYRNAGYAALDRYMDTLMMPHTTMPSQQLAQILEKDARGQGMMSNLKSGQQSLNQMYDAGNDPMAGAKAPTINDFTGKITDQQMKGYIRDNSITNAYEPGPGQMQGMIYQGVGSGNGPVLWGDQGPQELFAQGSPYPGAIKNELAQPMLNKAQGAYKNQQGLLQDVNQFYNGAYSDKEQQIARSYNAGLFNAPVMTKVGY